MSPWKVKSMRQCVRTGLILLFLFVASSSHALGAETEQAHAAEVHPDVSAGCNSLGRSHGGSYEGALTALVDESAVRLAWRDLQRLPGDPALGAADAEITVVEFIDYACPYCRRMAGDVLELVDAYPGIQVIFKEFPILGEASKLAAHASIAAARQQGWRTFHAALMGSAQSLTVEEAILAAAETAALDLDLFENDRLDPATAAIVERNRDLASRLGINTTPSIVIAGKVIRGAVSLDCLRLMVESHPDWQPDFGDDAAAWAAFGQNFLDNISLFESTTPALRAFDRAIALDPTEADYFAGRGHALWRDDKPAAVRDFSNAISLEDDDLKLARHYSSRGLLRRLIADDFTSSAFDDHVVYDHAIISSYRKHISSLYDSALKDFDAAIRHNPEDPGIYADRARCLVAIDRWMKTTKNAARIIQDFDKAIALARTHYTDHYIGNEIIGEMLIDRANHLIVGKNYLQAIRDLGQLSEYGDYYIWELLEPVGGDGLGHGFLEQVVGVVPSRVAAFLHQRRSYYWLNLDDHGRAILDADKAIGLSPAVPNHYAARADIRLSMADHDAAIGDYTEAIRLAPDNAGYYISRGKAWSERGNDGEAIADYDKAISLDPGRADYYEFRAIAFEGAGDHLAAVSDFSTAIELTSDDWTRTRYRFNRGVVWWNWAIEQTETHTRIEYYTHAILDFEEWSRRESREAEDRIDDHVISGLYLDESHEIASSVFAKAVELVSGEYAAALHTARANHWYKIGEYDRAILDHEEVVRLDGKNAWAFKEFAWLLATGPAQWRDGERAVELARHALTLTDEAYIRDTLAAALVEAGDPAAALLEYEKAMIMDSTLIGEYQLFLRLLGHDNVEVNDKYDAATRNALEACLRLGCQMRIPDAD